MLPPPTQANQRWSLDFMHDTLASGRTFRVLNIVDEYTREALAIAVDTSLSGAREPGGRGGRSAAVSEIQALRHRSQACPDYGLRPESSGDAAPCLVPDNHAFFGPTPLPPRNDTTPVRATSARARSPRPS